MERSIRSSIRADLDDCLFVASAAGTTDRGRALVLANVWDSSVRYLRHGHLLSVSGCAHLALCITAVEEGE